MQTKFDLGEKIAINAVVDRIIIDKDDSGNQQNVYVVAITDRSGCSTFSYFNEDQVNKVVEE